MVNKIGAIFGVATMAGVMATPATADESLCIKPSDYEENAAMVKEVYLAGSNNIVRMQCLEDADQTQKTCQMQVVQPSLQQVHNIAEVSYSFDADGALQIVSSGADSSSYTNGQVDDTLIEGKSYSVDRKLCLLQEEFEKAAFDVDDYRVENVRTPIEKEMAKNGGVTLAYNDEENASGNLYVGRDAINKIAVVPDRLGYVGGTQSENCTLLSDNSALCINRTYVPPVYGYDAKQESEIGPIDGEVVALGESGVTTTLTHHVLTESGLISEELMQAYKEWEDREIGHENNIRELGLEGKMQRHDTEPETPREASSVKPAYTAYTP